MNASACDVCNGARWLTAGESGALQLIPCPKCDIVRERQQVRIQERIQELQRRAGRLTRCTLETFNVDRPLFPVALDNGKTITPQVQRAKLRDAVNVVRDYIAQPSGWLYLYGAPGAGKSHLAMAVVNALVHTGWRAMYESVPDLLDFIKVGFKDDTAIERVNALKDVDVLLLDDIGAERESDWTDEKLFQVISSRNLRELPTLITSNYSPDALNYRIASRIIEVSQVLWLPVSDYRRTAQER